MYSKQIEQLVDLTVNKGQVSEKEKAILRKKAAAESVDIDEFALY